MNSGPRTVLLRPRPVRHAFLINLDSWKAENQTPEEAIDGIIDHALLRWEGLFTPILAFSSGELDVHQWSLLQLADVDQIHFATTPNHSTIKQIANDLSPIHVKVAHVHDGKPKFEAYGSGLRLKPETFDSFQNRPLLMFEFTQDCDPIVRRFLERNFGVFHQWTDSRQPENVRFMGNVEELLQTIPNTRFAISDRASLARFLNMAAGSRPAQRSTYVPPLSFTSRFQLGGKGLDFPQLRGDSQQYLIHIGDDLQDFTSHWNHIWFSGNLSAPYQNQLWLPLSLAKDAELHDALNNWLRHYSGSGNSNSKYTVATSASLTSEELAEVVKPIAEISGSPLCIHFRTSEELSSNRDIIREELDHEPSLFSHQLGVSRRLIHGTSGVVEVPPPKAFTDTAVQAPWMVDVQVEHEGAYGNESNHRNWRLPRRASGIAQHIFKAPSRINRAKSFSVELNHQTSFERIEPTEIRLQLPDEAEVIHWLMMSEPSTGYMTSDARTAIRQAAPFELIRISQNGRLTQGLLGLFGNLRTADHYLRNPFWQKLFRELTAINPRKDESLVRQAKQLLSKELRHLNPNVETIERASRKIAGMLSGRSTGQHRTLRQCERMRLKLASEERGQGSFSTGSTQLLVVKFGAFTREEMLAGFDNLVRKNILRIGVALTCSECGVRQWHSLQDLDQTVSCTGCDGHLTVPFNLQWSTQLNTLARSAVALGSLGVLQALNSLQSHATSMFFSPSYEFFRTGDRTPWHEVDVIAVVDGELVIGEVKEGRITSSDLDGLVEVCAVLKPSKALFFFNESEWRPPLATSFEETKSKLSAMGVTLEMHHLVIL